MSREAFEHWYADYTGDAHIRKYCDSTGRYQFNAMQSAWNAWQAALQSAEPVASVGSLNEFDAMRLVRNGYAFTDPLYTTPQPVVPEGTATPPCDCIENVNGRWVQSCECRNTGDLLSAQDWCTYNNLLSAGKDTV